MSFLERITATQYTLQELHITRNEDMGEIIATFEMTLHNASGDDLGRHYWETTLTETERSQLGTFVSNHRAEFETETGLTRHQKQ